MWSVKKRRRSLRTILTYAEMHRTWFVRGFLATMGVVAFRLLMPWPLRGVIEVVFPKGSDTGVVLSEYLPAGNPVLWLAGIYVLLAFGLGLSEMIQRVNIMRFASNTVHDMRAAAVRGARQMPQVRRTTSGDIITRIIGDSARIKAGLSGIIVHGLQNGMLFIAVCAVMLYISLPLGLIFLAAGVVALMIGLYTSLPVAATASKQRRKEGNYAAALQEGLDYGGLDLRLEEINWSSARKEVRTTKIIAQSSLYVHVVLAVAVAVALWVGSKGVAAGRIAPGELFLFIAYALTVHRRMVQVGRQAARTGKVLACADKIGYYLRHTDKVQVAEPEAEKATLEKGLRLEAVKLASVKGRGGRPRLKRSDLVIEPGTHLAVIGEMASGKSSLLQLLAGAELPDKGRILWDDRDVTEGQGILSSMVAYLPQDPVFPPLHVWKLFGLEGPDALAPEDEQTLRDIGAWKVIQTFPKGLAHKIGSTTISRNEARLLRLAAILLDDGFAVWVLDSPVQGLKRKNARKCIEEIFRRAGDRAVVISMLNPVSIDRFDRAILLRNGKVAYDGPPGMLAEWKKSRRKQMTKA